LSLIIIALLYFVGAFILRLATVYIFPADFSEKAVFEAQYHPAQIFDEQGKLLATLAVSPRSRYVESAEIPAELKEAVVALMDENFYQHRGIDWIDLAKTVWSKLTRRQVTGAGSTITQQLVRKVFLKKEIGYWRKLKELALAYRLEKELTKDEILERYLNIVYFGSNFYGVEAAAHGYFGKDASQLSLNECALLAGLLSSPSQYNPFTRPQKALERRNFTLKQMRKSGYLAGGELSKASKEPLKLNPEAPPPRFAPFFVDYVEKSLLERLSPDEIYKGSLRVETTLDRRFQKLAQVSLDEVLNQPHDPVGVMVVMEPRTGHVKAIACSSNYKNKQFNLAISAHRQPGSAFKPFVLIAALENNFSLSQTFSAEPGKLKLPDGDVWQVSNYDEQVWHRPLTLEEATINSVNAVYARLVLKVGADEVVEVAKRMGIETPLSAHPAIALGGLRWGVTPLEMATAYATLASLGIYAPPTPIRSVILGGEKVWSEQYAEAEVLDPEIALKVTQVLEKVITEGTAQAASIGREAAGKTGTSQAFRDAWFIGYTPNLVACIWVGYPEKPHSMQNVRGVKVAGGTWPAQIWAKFMRRALEDTPPASFSPREGSLTLVKVCPDSGLLATPECPNPVRIYLEQELVPQRRCNLHGP
jgi:penicillin-binding protein 1A